MSWLTIFIIGTTNIIVKNLARVLPLVWAGMIIGVSLIATPIKFKAPLLDLPTAVDVGRVTFDFFNSIEWVMLLTLIILYLFKKAQLVWIVILLVCLSLQSYWLLPVLNAKVTAIIQGIYVESGIHHGFYGCLEAIKLIALFCVCTPPTIVAGTKTMTYDSST